ncbi:DUF6452 family protein [Chryseolinea sp. T2]|uniref:DUF6452 family protein n=1 Tax=Chryseolinea sp. T2 TaxID=3129255 RepID=UPI00307733F9
MKRLSWFVFFSIFTFSCLDQPDCYQLNNNVMVIAFKIIGGGTDVYNLAGVSTPGTDTVFLAGATGSSSVKLPLNPYATEIGYTFDGYYGGINTGEPKHLDLSYKSLVQFVSEDCGERYVFSDIAPTSTDFDSIRILNSVPTQPPSSNLEIYRCPRTNILYVDFVADVAIDSIKFGPNERVPVGATLSEIWLPLNLLADSSTYIFNYTDASFPDDTLKVTYLRTTKTLSPKCGVQNFISKLRYDTLNSSFTTPTLKEDSIYDLPKINFELTR